MNEVYRGVCGVIISKKWKEAYTTEVKPEIGFLKKWKETSLQYLKVGGMVSKCVPLSPAPPHRVCPYFISHLARQTRPFRELELQKV